MRPVHRILLVVASLVLGVGGIVGALMYVNRTPAAETTADPQTTEISRETLAQNDGKDGRKCYVAVDGTVYQIEGSPLWVSGKHEPSGGQASCGRDLTDVIGQSPHGRSKLNLLTVVGKLKK